MLSQTLKFKGLSSVVSKEAAAAPNVMSVKPVSETTLGQYLCISDSFTFESLDKEHK